MAIKRYWVVGAFCIVILAGCAETRRVLQEHRLDKSGFLGHDLYKKLTAGDETQLEAAFRWRDEQVAMKQYTKILIDPVILYRQPQDAGGGYSNEEAQILLNYLHTRTVEEISKYVTVVEKPTTGAMRLHVALTDYEQTWVAMDMISTLHPVGRVIAEATGLAVEKPSFVGGAQIEYKLIDSVSGKTLAAGIDRRVGGKTLGKGFSRWADVRGAMDYWAVQAAYRLCMSMGQSNCARPTYGAMGSLGTETPK